MARTWHFHVTLRMPRLSQQEEVRDTFKGILISANNRLPLCGVEQSSFSYDVPDDGIATIDGYLHVNSRSLLANTAVSKWIFDDRIIEDIVWTPIRPGLNGDWRQHSLIKRVLAAGDDFDGGTESGPRRLEDWVGTSSEKIDRGGCPRQNRAQSANQEPAENGGSEADPAGDAPPPRGRGRPARPSLVEEDTAAQAAVRSKLRSMLVDTLRAICTILIPNHKTTKRTPKESFVNLLVSMPDKLALLAAALCIAGESGAASQEPTDTSGAVVSSQKNADTRAALRAILQGRAIASSGAEAAAPTLPPPPPPAAAADLRPPPPPAEVQGQTPPPPPPPQPPLPSSAGLDSVRTLPIPSISLPLSRHLCLSSQIRTLTLICQATQTTTTSAAPGPSSCTNSIPAQVCP